MTVSTAGPAEIMTLPVVMTATTNGYEVTVGNYPAGTILKQGGHWLASHYDAKQTFETPNAAARQLLHKTRALFGGVQYRTGPGNWVMS